ncbi:FKBP-type peptidyl-prolyl cis-trans isomerase [sediment metagenome]|uniref:peptidylprolyl isomerase n=1 Tax=sediment metagenome TaxID=749907 RepID=D9PEV4_9ZZZZ
MKLAKKDFISVEFTGRIKDGEVFDSNIKGDLAKLDPKVTPKPFIFCLGEGMFLKGIEDFLIGKDIGEYTIELSPEKAFGPRDPKQIQMIPMKIFVQHKINPVPGVMFNFDGRMAKILTVSGGRVMTDFNNPLAGKNVSYKIKVLKKVEDLNEKVKSFIEFLFRQDLQFEIKEKKLIIEVNKQMSKFVELFKEKFKDIFDLDLEVKEIEDKKSKGKKEIKQEVK